METIILELRAAEGGKDAKLLIEDMAGLYAKVAKSKGFTVETDSWRDGFISLWISGKNSYKHFKNETGGHRWQRVPPTERRGRMHTSTVTIAVLKKNQYQEVTINQNEVHTIYTKDSGPGGQHRNKVESCVVLTHLPTGIKVKNADSSSQHKNKVEAWRELTKRVNHFYKTGKIEKTVEERRDQIGTGNRGEHIRTYNTKSDRVTNHTNDRSCSLKKFMRGNLGLIV